MSGISSQKTSFYSIKDASAINKKAMYGKILYGFGLNKIPETVPFGKNVILLKSYTIMIFFLLATIRN